MKPLSVLHRYSAPMVRTQPKKNSFRFSSSIQWDTAQYLSFEDHRMKPAMDLLANIPLDNPATIADLGCGTGNVTQRIHQRWPNAAIRGIDHSRAMLHKARQIKGPIHWQQQDIAQWNPRTKPELIYSNATLNWLPNHAQLLPQLLGKLKPGGILAIQMPRNFEAPSHALMYEIAEIPPFHNTFESLDLSPNVLSPQDYYRILSPITQSLRIWETDYIQTLEGDNPVADFTKGTWLNRFLEVLDEPLRGQFEQEYRQRVAQAYPKQPDGKTLFPFRRLFMIAQAPTFQGTSGQRHAFAP